MGVTGGFPHKRSETREFVGFWFLAASKQLYECFSPSVRLPVRPSVTPFWLFPSSHHHEIFRSYYQCQKWCPCKRSKVTATDVITQLSRFRTVTPARIYIWWWNDALSLMLLGRGALLFFKVIRLISRWHGYKNRRFWPNWGFPDCNSSLNLPMATNWCTKL